MEINSDTPIGRIASEMEGAIPYFEKLKIDYTCEGDKTLRAACDGAGIPFEETAKALEEIRKEGIKETHWDQRPLSEIVEHILRRHHDYTHIQVEKLNGLLKEATRAYGFKHPQLIMLKDLFLEMGGEMRGHMSREEELLFPYLLHRERGEATQEDIPNPFLESPFFRQPVRILQWEHRMTGEEWAQIHLLTDEYRLSETSGDLLRSLYRELRALEEDLHRHVHLENNILFRRAIEKGWIQ